MNTHDKYWWVMEHPEFINADFIPVEIQVEPHMVCPSTERIENYKPLNTKLQYWLEFYIPIYVEEDKKWVRGHDTNCDTGGWTYEEAIDSLYDLVLKEYGPYTQEDIDKKEEEVFNFSNTPTFSMWKNSRPEREWKDDLLDDLSATFLPKDLQDLMGYKNALIEFQKTATVQQSEEITALLVGIEHDKWCMELSIKTGIDFT